MQEQFAQQCEEDVIGWEELLTKIQELLDQERLDAAEALSKYDFYSDVRDFEQKLQWNNFKEKSFETRIQDARHKWVLVQQSLNLKRDRMELLDIQTWNGEIEVILFIVPPTLELCSGHEK